MLSKKDHEDFMKKGDSHGDWAKLAGVVDSGAVTSVSPSTTAPWIPLYKTDKVERKIFYVDAGGNKIYNEGEKVYEGFSDNGIPIDTPVQVAKVQRTLFAVREMKAASNIVVWGLGKDYAIVEKKTGKTIYEDGDDAVINKRSKAVTKIIDNGKDYVINIWLKKPKGEDGGSMSTVSKWNQLGHGRWGKKDSDPIPTKNSFRALEDDEQYATF